MNDIHAIKPPIETPVLTQNLINLLWILGLIVLLIFFLSLAYYFWRKRKTTIIVDEDKNIKVEQIDYQVLIRDKLNKLKVYIDKEEFKIFHIKLSKIIREYLSYKYNDNFIDMTASEVLRNRKLSSKENQYLNDFFSKSDMIKFAKRPGNKKDAENIYALVKSFTK